MSKLQAMRRRHAKMLRESEKTHGEAIMCHCCGVVAVYSPGLCVSCQEAYESTGEPFANIVAVNFPRVTAFNPRIQRI